MEASKMFAVDISGQIRFKGVVPGVGQDVDLADLAKQNTQFGIDEKHNKPHKGELYETRI